MHREFKEMLDHLAAPLLNISRNHGGVSLDLLFAADAVARP